MPSQSFLHFLSELVSTKRNPSISGGKRGVPITRLTNVKCTQRYPVSQETALQIGLNTPYTAWEVYVEEDQDIQAGDVLVMDDAEYPIRYTDLYPWPGGLNYRRVVIEEHPNV